MLGVQSQLWHYLLGVLGGFTISWSILMSGNG